MNKSLTRWTLLSLTILCFAACKQDQIEETVYHYYPEDFEVLSRHLNIPSQPLDYSPALPAHLNGFSVGVGGTSNDLATLGRVIFYDKHVSSNGEVSCASCHKQELGFADDKAFSDGVDDEVTERNSLALGAFVSFRRYYDSVIGGSRAGFFWDEGAPLLEDQAKLTIENSKEMNMDLNELVHIMNDLEYYEILFKKAYGDEGEITPDRITLAVSEFVNVMISADSPFDRAHPNSAAPSQLNSDWEGFSPAQNRGKMVFVDNCSSCHGFSLSPAFAFDANVAQTVANNGLDASYTDNGVAEVTGFSGDNGKFKVPLLRNVELTGPYMHDGRFETLEDVVDHYSEGIQFHPNLDSKLRNGNQARQMNFSDQEKSDLIEFLKTLTDETMITAERFSDPFKS